MNPPTKWEDVVATIKRRLGGNDTFDARNADAFLSLVRTDCFNVDDRVDVSFGSPTDNEGIYTITVRGSNVMSLDMTSLSDTITEYGYINSAVVAVAESELELRICFYKMTSNKHLMRVNCDKIEIRHRCDEKLPLFNMFRLSNLDRKLVKEIVEVVNNMNKENQPLVKWAFAANDKNNPDTYILIAKEVVSIPVVYLNLIKKDIGKGNIESIIYCFDDSVKTSTTKTPMILFNCKVQKENRYNSKKNENNDRNRDRD